MHKQINKAHKYLELSSDSEVDDQMCCVCFGGHHDGFAVAVVIGYMKIALSMMNSGAVCSVCTPTT